MERPKIDAGTSMAVQRTLAAYDRTMLAWVRTATSLITFGFGVDKFSDVLRMDASQRNYVIVGLPQFGFVMVCVGVLSLVLAVYEHRRKIHELGVEYRSRSRSLAVIVAGIIALLGIWALASMIIYR